MAAVRANRAFLARAVRYMAAAGVRQFLDIGPGIPTAGHTHEVAQRAAADDGDTRADLRSTAHGGVARKFPSATAG